jgi:DNA-binding NtrC family response regulator
MESLTILIVDDEEDLLVALAERLTLRGLTVEKTTRGAEALSLLEQHDFGVVLLDLRMPGIDGLALLAQIKQKYPDLPVILFTGLSSVGEAESGLQRGAFSYLMKPIDIEKLLEEIRRAASTGGGPNR